jgi:hypothetical protein
MKERAYFKGLQVGGMACPKGQECKRLHLLKRNSAHKINELQDFEIKVF